MLLPKPDETLFDQINRYLVRVNEREKQALETEFRLKQMLSILGSKSVNVNERFMIDRAHSHLKELQDAKAGGRVIQAKARFAWFRRKV